MFFCEIARLYSNSHCSYKNGVSWEECTYAANFVDVTAFQSIRRKDYSVPLLLLLPYQTFSTFYLSLLSFMHFLMVTLKILIFSYSAPDPNPYEPLVFRPSRLGSGFVIYLYSSSSSFGSRSRSLHSTCQKM